jgi:hypothetical protein
MTREPCILFSIFDSHHVTILPSSPVPSLSVPPVASTPPHTTIHLLVPINQLLPVLRPPTPTNVPARLPVPNPAVHIPSPISTLKLAPVIHIAVPALRPAPIHAVNAQAVETPQRGRPRARNFLAPVDAAVPTRALEPHGEGFEHAEDFDNAVFRERLFERVRTGLDERGEVVACGGGLLVARAHVVAVVEQRVDFVPDAAVDNGAEGAAGVVHWARV